MIERTTQYPHHLARLAAERFRAEGVPSPPETVLTRLLETLYFASLKTEEGRRVLCTVNYVDPAEADREGPRPADPGRWSFARFDRPLPFDVRTLRKLGRAADPAVASLAVYSDRKRRLVIWGMVDREPRYGDEISLDPSTTPRPGLFQVLATGPGNLSVYRRGMLVASLVQNVVVEEHHNVLWSGPVHAALRSNLEASLEGYWRLRPPAVEPMDDLLGDLGSDNQGLRRELLVRWINSLGRILVNMQDHRHGGGLLIAPERSPAGLSVNYPLRYDRLPKALLRLAETRLRALRARPEQVAAVLGDLEKQKAELLGAVRFVAALSRVDGIVLFDQVYAVRGFGVELRADTPLAEAYVAGDAEATTARLRRVDLAQFGTRHRAMIRYCHEDPGTLGFSVSQDGEIQVMMEIDGRLVLWENVDIQRRGNDK